MLRGLKERSCTGGYTILKDWLQPQREAAGAVTFDQFDFSFQPSIDERQIRDLRTLRFVHEAIRVTADTYAHAIHGQDDEAVRRWEKYRQRNRPSQPTGTVQ